MVSPANTFACLTESRPGGCESSEPDKYYPTGDAQLRCASSPHDTYQGAAVAEFAQAQGVKNVFILNDKEAYGLGVATTFPNAAEAVGIEIAGFAAWDPKASSYEALFQKIKATGADAVFLGGLTDENGAQVIKDKVAVLGPNDGDVKLLAPDGFTQQSTIDEAGAADAQGMFMTRRGRADRRVHGRRPGRSSTASRRAAPGRAAIDPYAIYGAQAAQVLLDAIAGVGRHACRRDRRSCSRRRSRTGSSARSRSTRTATRRGRLGRGRRLHDLPRPRTSSTTKTTLSPKPETVDAAGGS